MSKSTKNVVKDDLLFNLTMDFVGSGLYSGQTAHVVIANREKTIQPNSPTSRGKVSANVRVGSRFHMIAQILDCAWCFSLGVDAGNNLDAALLDVRIKVAVNPEVQNLHGVAAPLTGRHTGENMKRL